MRRAACETPPALVPRAPSPSGEGKAASCRQTGFHGLLAGGRQFPPRSGRVPEARGRVGLLHHLSVCVALLGLASSGLTACGRQGPPAARWIAEARAISRADAGAAQVGALVAFAAQPVPVEISADDQRRVLQDVYGQLCTQAAASTDASRWATAGLGLGEADDAFTARLHLCRGRAFESQGATRAAIADYARVQAIDLSLLERLVGADGGVP